MNTTSDMNVQKNRTSKQKIDRETLFSKVDNLTIHNENRPYSVAQIKKSAPYRKIVAEDARVMSRQEKKFDEYKVFELDKLVKQIGMLQNYRKKLEFNMKNDPNLAHQKDLVNAEYNIIEQETQSKIDKLKSEMISLSEFYQDRKAKLEEMRNNIDLSRKTKGEKNLELDYLYKENKKLLNAHEEKLAEMTAEMTKLNTEMEDNHRAYTQKIAKISASKTDLEEQIKKCKEMEDICVLSARVLASEMKKKDQDKQNAIFSSFRSIFGDRKKAGLSKNMTISRSYTQRIVDTLRGIYNYLCKKLLGSRREKARTQGKRAIEKQLESDFSKTSFGEKRRSNIAIISHQV